MAKDPKFVAARDRIAELMMGNLSMSPEEAAALDEEKEARYAQIKPSSLVPAPAEGGDEVEEMDADEEAQIEETETDADLGSLPKSRFRTKRGKSLKKAYPKTPSTFSSFPISFAWPKFQSNGDRGTNYDKTRKQSQDEETGELLVLYVKNSRDPGGPPAIWFRLSGEPGKTSKPATKSLGRKSLDNPKKGDLFDWYGEVRIVTRVNKDGSIDTQRPHVDSFGKEMLLDGKTFKRYELGHMRRVSGYYFPKPGYAVAE